MARRLAAVSVLVMGAVAGCGATDGNGGPVHATGNAESGARASTGKASEGLKISATGFGLQRSNNPGLPDYLWAVAMIKNGSANLIGVNVSFAAYDASGKVLGQSSQSANLLRAGTTSAIGTQIDVPAGSEVAKVVGTADELDSLSEKDSEPRSQLTTQGVRFQADQYSPKLLGEVVSDHKEPQKRYISKLHVSAQPVASSVAAKPISSQSALAKASASPLKVS